VIRGIESPPVKIRNVATTPLFPGLLIFFSRDDIRPQPLIERKKELRWVLRNARDGVQYVEHVAGGNARA
jgi:hypothetical protein